MNNNRRNTLEIEQEIMSKLMDNTLLSRYGTSLQMNMGSEYQKKIRQKYKDLQEEFNHIDKNKDDTITIDELVSFLNTTNEAVKKFLYLYKDNRHLH